MNNKVVCPNCGTEGTEGRFCEYCGTKISIPETERKKKSNYDSDEEMYILEFQTSEEDAVQKMLYKLSGKYIPEDFFQNCKVDEVKPCYVPVYYYQCSFDASWSCVELVKRDYTVYNKTTGRNETKTTYDRYPRSGFATGSRNYITCAGRKEDLPGELYDFINDDLVSSGKYFYDKSNERKLTDKELAILVEKAEESPSVLWSQNCVRLLDARVERVIERQISHSHEDLSYSYTFDNPSLTMILPFWVVCYSYKGEKYIFVTDGLAEQTRFKSPIDEKKSSECDAIKKDLDRKGDISMWCLVFFLVSSFLTILSFFLLLGTYTTEFEKRFFVISLSAAIISGVMLKTMLNEQMEAEAKQSKFLNDMRMQRKHQLLSALTYNSYGMTDSKTKELRHTIEKEIQLSSKVPLNGNKG